MSYDDLPLIALLVGLMAASGVCSGSETAIFRLSHADRAKLRQTAPRAAHAIETLLAHPRGTLVTVLLLNMIVNVLYFVGSSLLSLRLENPWLSAATGIVALFAIILVGEILAKLIAGSLRLQVAVLIAQPLLLVYRVVSPVRVVIDSWIVAPLVRLMLPDASPGRLTLDELTTLIEQGARAGAIVDDEEQLLAEVVSLRDRRVREILTPRVEMVSVRVDDTPDQVRRIVADARQALVPVVRDSLDSPIEGVLDARAYLVAVELAQLRGDRTLPELSKFTSPAVFVPENVRLDRLLERFRETGTSWAIVVDERGTISGIVEIEDVIDAMSFVPRDRAGDEAPSVRLVEPGVWSVSADLSVRDWAEHFPSARHATRDLLSRVSTLGGLVLAKLGHFPAPGEVTHLDNIHLEVESVTDRRLERIRVSLDDGGEP